VFQEGLLSRQRQRIACKASLSLCPCITNLLPPPCSFPESPLAANFAWFLLVWPLCDKKVIRGFFSFSGEALSFRKLPPPPFQTLLEANSQEPGLPNRFFRSLFLDHPPPPTVCLVTISSLRRTYLSLHKHRQARF